MSIDRTANLLGALAWAIVERVNAATGGLGVGNETPMAALNLIDQHAGCTQIELGDILGLPNAAVRALLDELAGEGRIGLQQVEGPRALALQLTETGRLDVQAYLRQRRIALHEIVGLLSSYQQLQLDSISETVLESLTETADAGCRLCRLCDAQCCPEDECPVHRRAAGRCLQSSNHVAENEAASSSGEAIGIADTMASIRAWRPFSPSNSRKVCDAASRTLGASSKPGEQTR